MYKEKWQVTIPIEKFLRLDNDPLSVDNVTVMQIELEGRIQSVARTQVEIMMQGLSHGEGPYPRLAISAGYAAIDSATAKLSYASGMAIIPKYEYFLELIDPPYSKELEVRGWRWHFHIVDDAAHSLTSTEKVKSRISEISILDPEKKKVFEKAASLYREALNTPNPLIALILHFSSVQAILRGSKLIRITGPMMRDALHEVSSLKGEKFIEMFDQIWGDDVGRNAVDHGWLDITNPSLIIHARLNGLWLRGWNRAIIEKYLVENTKGT